MTDFIRVGTPLSVLLLGLLAGTAFGFVIFKAGASRYEKILNMLLLRDLGIAKFMMTAVMTAAIGIFIAERAGVIALTIKPTQVLALIIGGLIFGIGFALLGYCPGTAMVALGEGKKDAVFGVLGGFVGAAVFAHFYPVLNRILITPSDYGKLTIPNTLGISYGAGVVLLLAVFGGAIVVMNLLGAERKTGKVHQQSITDVKLSAERGLGHR
jgi:uncharacterized protein